jgi:hypothetical protein
MKSTSVFSLIFLISLNCFSQSLEGEWKGEFHSDYENSQTRIPGGNVNALSLRGWVNLKFILNEDSSYTVYSLYKGIDAVNVCEVLYKRINKDSIYLEETKIIKPESNTSRLTKKRMYLKIQQRKKSIVLIGRWIAVRKNPGRAIGDIRFYKKIEKKRR